MTLDSAFIRKAGGYCGFAAIVIYLLGTIMAAVQYPEPFSPFSILISNLGNYVGNPAGAIFYNGGAIVAGLLLVPFFVSIAPWYDMAKNRKFFYIGAELFGISLALGMVMQAIYSQDTPLHRPWSTVCFFSILLMLLLANYALLKNPKFSRPVGYYGFAAAVANIAFMALYALNMSPTILEWIAVYGGLLWILLLSLNAQRT